MPTQSESSTPAASMTPRMFCRKCGYALVGLESRVCPECGRGFDPGNRRTFAVRPPRGWVWRWGRRVVALVLLLMLTAGAGLAWLWWGWHAEQPTVGRLRATGQLVNVAPIGSPRLRSVMGERLGSLTDRVDWVELNDLEATDTDLLDFRSLPQIQRLVLRSCQVSNGNFNRLAGLAKLRLLGLYELRIKNPDLGFLEKLPALSMLSLRGKWVSSAGVEHIGRLAHLEYLDLTDTGLSDADLLQLRGLSSLKQLNLQRNPISDAGLEHLQGLKSLQRLVINERLVGSAGAAKLKQAIPGLKVMWPYLYDR